MAQDPKQDLDTNTHNDASITGAAQFRVKILQRAAMIILGVNGAGAIACLGVMVTAWPIPDLRNTFGRAAWVYTFAASIAFAVLMIHSAYFIIAEEDFTSEIASDGVPAATILVYILGSVLLFAITIFFFNFYDITSNLDYCLRDFPITNCKPNF